MFIVMDGHNNNIAPLGVKHLSLLTERMTKIRTVRAINISHLAVLKTRQLPAPR